MFFTKEDYEKIELYLKLNAKKDTDFPITTAVTDDDYIAIILNGLNRIISIKNLRESISSGISASISVSPNTIYAATSTEVTIEVLVNKVASSITLYRNVNLIGYVLNSNFLLVEENIIALAGTEITYKAVIVVEGIEEPLIRQFTLSAEKMDSNMKWNLDSLTFEINADYTGNFPELINIPSGNTVTYSSQDLNVATINSLGLITIIGQGTTIISASIAESETYNSKTVNYTLKVNRAICPISWSKNSVENIIGGPYTLPQLSNTEHLAVTLSSSNTNVAEILSQDTDGVPYNLNIKDIGTTVITATFEGNNKYSPASPSYNLIIKPVPITDYYVGWATGENSGFDAFASLSTEQLLAISTDYNRTSTFNKTVSSSEAVGTRQIFFIMWRDESAPKSGSVTSGGITENLQASDFTDTNVFRATHADIIVDDVTYHVAGLRGAFDAGDKFVINF